MESEIGALERQASKLDFWNDSAHAQRMMQRLSTLKEDVATWRGLERELSDLQSLVGISLDEGDASLQETLSREAEALAKRLEDLEFTLALSGEHDYRNSILAIHAGAGGVDSQDWAQILLRMFLRWAERRGYKGEVLDLSPGDEAGIKSSIVQISGKYAYGYLKSERGVHRLVRLSPFNADHMRHTSFALVEVMPEAEEEVDVAINPDDLRIDAFKSSGAGGQSVQKNATAVRITHIPTGIKVSCQNERSQFQNKEIAMRVLRARLMEHEMQKRAEVMAKLKGAHVSPEWGNQIRSYVLHPYKMVKDHRTGHETADANGVLDGDLDPFLKAYLSNAATTRDQSTL